jgi:tetratricopeptide (TPR) repeat protein
MPFGVFLFASIVGTALAFHEELSSHPAVVYVYDPFPDCVTEEQKRLYEMMESGYANQKYDICIEAAEKLMKLFPSCPWLYMRRAMCYGQTSRYDEGLADFVHALELDGASDGGKTYVLGPNRQRVLDDIELLKNMKLAHQRALAQSATQRGASKTSARRSRASTGSAEKSPDVADVPQKGENGNAGKAAGARPRKTPVKRTDAGVGGDTGRGTTARRRQTGRE